MENETKKERFLKFIDRHKVVITYTVATVVTTTACVAANRMANNGMVEFLKENNLWDEYLIAGEE